MLEKQNSVSTAKNPKLKIRPHKAKLKVRESPLTSMVACLWIKCAAPGFLVALKVFYLWHLHFSHAFQCLPNFMSW